MEEKRLNDLVVGKNRGLGKPSQFTIDSYMKSQVVNCRVCRTNRENKSNPLIILLIMRLCLEPLRLTSLLPLRMKRGRGGNLVVIHLCLSLLHHARKLPQKRVLEHRNKGR